MNQNKEEKPSSLIIQNVIGPFEWPPAPPQATHNQQNPTTHAQLPEREKMAVRNKGRGTLQRREKKEKERRGEREQEEKTGRLNAGRNVKGKPDALHPFIPRLPTPTPSPLPPLPLPSRATTPPLPPSTPLSYLFAGCVCWCCASFLVCHAEGVRPQAIASINQF